MLTAIIIEDKISNVETLMELIKAFCPTVDVVAHASNITDGHVLLQLHKPDILFLDIEMAGGNGFDLLSKIKDVTFEIIFTTAYHQYAINAFRENAIDYLLKPIDIALLQTAVAKAEKQIELKKSAMRPKAARTIPIIDKISLPTSNGYQYVATMDIVRCEASGSYSNIHFRDGKKVVVSMRLKECERLLPPDIFIRVHNSHIVNINYIQRYIRGKGGQLIMSDNFTVGISQARKEFFHDAMKKLNIHDREIAESDGL